MGCNQECDPLNPDVVAYNNFLERIFLTTMDPGLSVENSLTRPVAAALVYQGDNMSLSLHNISEILDERFASSVSDMVIVQEGDINPDAIESAGESDAVQYLYHCFWRLGVEKANMKVMQKIEKSIVEKTDELILDRTARQLLEDDSSKARLTFASIFGELGNVHNENDSTWNFYLNVCLRVDILDPQGGLLKVLTPALEQLRHRFVDDLHLGYPEVQICLRLVSLLTSHKVLGKCFLQHSQPIQRGPQMWYTANEGPYSEGCAFHRSLLGAILSISCLPGSGTQFGVIPNAPPREDFFLVASRYRAQVIEADENHLHRVLGDHHDSLSSIFFALLKLGPECKDMLLSWIGSFLVANKNWGQIWSSREPFRPELVRVAGLSGPASVLGLTSVLLRLCDPFMSSWNHPRLSSISHLYLRDPNIEAKKLPMVEDVFLHTSQDEATSPNFPQSYSGATELFYMTHKAFLLSYHVCFEKMMSLYQTLVRLQNESRESSEMSQIRDAVDVVTGQYLSVRCALREPSFLRLSICFMVSTCSWLTRSVTLGLNFSPDATLRHPLSVSFPNIILSSVPEFIVSNIIDQILFLKRFQDEALETLAAGAELNWLMELVLLFMGSSECLVNPHLRAKLAELLECLIPPSQISESTAFTNSICSGVQRELLFKNHPGVEEIAPAVLCVFSSIETTGQSVNFEQKFSYRQPMYVILKYLWNNKIHRRIIKNLSDDAEKNMDASEPPIFLRFLNLLVNDAIFLLDEGLSYLKQIKEKQVSVANEDLSDEQRAEAKASLSQLYMIARFHNVMSTDTIQTLDMMSVGCCSVYTHNFMVDRVAGMLNYFLKELVGPQRRALNVRDLRKDLKFHPGDLVATICSIILKLGVVESFRFALVRDERSFSLEIYEEASTVLYKVYKGELAAKLQVFTKQLKDSASTGSSEDDALVAAAPDEFLDPIMGTIMVDPVILPSSKKVVDRTTIARHILSDQSDPFNRDHLSMADIISNTDLKTQIDLWLKTMKKDC